MAYIRVCPLFVLTLLQLCRAEISDSLSEAWYSANVINDGFQPKPISEIFSTESPFSSTNPIIVLPKSTYTPDEIALLSTLPPPRKISTTSTSADFTQTSFSSSTPRPPTFQTAPPSTYQTIPPSSIQTTFSTFQTTPSKFQTSPATFQTTPSTISDFSSSQAPPISSQPFSIEPEIQRTTLSVPQTPSPGSPQSQSQQIRLELVPQSQFQIPGQNAPGIQAYIPPQETQTSTGGPLSNYFLIYQQAPQNIQGFPGSAQGVTQFTTAAQEVSTPTPSTVIISPAPTLSPPSTRTASPTSSTPFPSTVRVRTTQTPRTIDCRNTTNTLLGALPPLRIRVVAPSGSITNLHINPTSKTTTTRRPTTTRTRRTSKPRKNTYEACTDGCKGRREPICAAPLSTTFLDPETLKGFPSVCHMACHNSYRRDSYEKVLDGRCSRLRTRIRTVDSNKLKRDELNKAQYFLDNSGKTIVEFTALQ